MRHSGGISDNMRVAVLAGGWSSERDVSLKSGAAVAEALKRRKYEVLMIDPAHDLTRFAAQIVSARPDVIFNALHGTGGEDGIIAGALEMSGIPYTHSGVTASAVAMDKKLTKMIAQQLNVAVAEDKIIQRSELAQGHPIAPPYVVKPVADGSSVGVTIVQNDMGEALKGDPNQRMIVERYIAGDELTVAVLETENGAEALGVTRLEPKTGFYDYAAKYTDGMTVHKVNPDLPLKILNALKEAALTMHKGLGCAGVSRSDFRYNDTDGIVFLETNTHPGMTTLSLLPEQAAAKNIDFETLVVTIMDSAFRRFEQSKKAAA
jgi:D-alanine-D-alanine ligase